MIKFQTNPTQRHAICQRPKLQKEIDGVNYGAVCQLSQPGRLELSLSEQTGQGCQGQAICPQRPGPTTQPFHDSILQAGLQAFGSGN